MSHLSVLAFSSNENVLFNGEQEKESISREDDKEKSVPRDHRLSSLGKPRDTF